MIPESSSVSRCIQVNLSLFLPGFLYPNPFPLPCTFFCVLSYLVLSSFSLKIHAEVPIYPQSPHVWHKSSAAQHSAWLFMQPRRGRPTAHASSPSPLADTDRAPPQHTVEANQPLTGGRVSSLSLLCCPRWSSCRLTRHSLCSLYIFLLSWAPSFAPLLCSIASKRLFFTQ